MTKFYLSTKNGITKSYNDLNKSVVHQCKSPKLFNIGFLLAVDMDASVVLIVMLLVAAITFLVGTAYGIYLNDKISTKEDNRTLSS